MPFGCDRDAGSGGGGGGGGGTASSGEILIGHYASMTGDTATFGVSADEGIRLAMNEINNAGGVLGRKVRVITTDDRSLSDEAKTAVERLINQDKVVALLGEVASSRSIAAAPIAQRARIPMLSPASTNPKVTEIGDYIFRICFIDPFQGTVMAKFALSKGWKRVAVLTDVKQDYSVGLSQFFKEYFLKNGGTIVSEQNYSSGDKDFKAQLTTIKGSNPEAILASGYYTEAGLIASQARELGITVPLLGGDGWDSPSLVEVGGKAMEGNFFSNHFSVEDTSPQIQEFIKKYQAKYNEGTDAMAALGYDSAMILGDAIKRAGTTESAKLRDAIAATKDFPGITGKITIDEKRNASKPAVILTIKDGKFKYVETVAP
jgi:branched-chain amino acid transport system substrate-binding protein